MRSKGASGTSRSISVRRTSTTSPRTRAVDLAWSLEDGMVRFFAHAEKPAAVMTELFVKTFGLKFYFK